MSELKNFYKVRPDELEPHDAIAAVIICHLDYKGDPVLYRTTLDYLTDKKGIPQGHQFAKGERAMKIGRELFPVLTDYELYNVGRGKQARLLEDKENE